MINETEQLKQENAQWGADHQRWLSEMKQWSHQTQRLVGVLHKLERALPKHTAQLERHINLIKAHETEIRRYECGLETRCLPGCESYKTMVEQRQFHRRIKASHLKMHQHHDDFRERYLQQLQQFKSLAQQLLAELEI